MHTIDRLKDLENELTMTRESLLGKQFDAHIDQDKSIETQQLINKMIDKLKVIDEKILLCKKVLSN